MKKLLSTIFITALYLTNGASAMEKTILEVSTGPTSSPTQGAVNFDQKNEKAKIMSSQELESLASLILNNPEFEPFLPIFGVNNTRIGEVKADMYDYIQQEYGAKVIFVTDHPEEAHYKVADGVWEHSISSRELKDAQRFIEQCLTEKKRPIGFYPFSDAGTQMAALLSYLFKLPGDDPEKIYKAYSKAAGREAEREIAKTAPETFPPGYEIVFSEKVFSFERFKELVEEYGVLFVKPDDQGNSRGCSRVTKDNYVEVWEKLKPYIDHGIEVEEFIDESHDEYCVDSTGYGKGWILRKINTLDHGVEIKYELVATYSVVDEEVQFYGLSKDSNLELEDVKNIHASGRFMNALVGGTEDAIHHNELRYNPKTKKIKTIESNKRLPGLYITYAINGSCVLVNPQTQEQFPLSTHKLSIDTVTGNKKLENYILEKKQEAVFSMVLPLKDGVITGEPSEEAIANLLTPFNGKFYPNKKIGDKVQAELLDNSSRYGGVMLFGDNLSDLRTNLEKSVSEIQQLIVIQ